MKKMCSATERKNNYGKKKYAPVVFPSGGVKITDPRYLKFSMSF